MDTPLTRLLAAPPDERRAALVCAFFLAGAILLRSPLAGPTVEVVLVATALPVIAASLRRSWRTNSQLSPWNLAYLLIAFTMEERALQCAAVFFPGYAVARAIRGRHSPRPATPLLLLATQTATWVLIAEFVFANAGRPRGSAWAAGLELAPRWRSPLGDPWLDFVAWLAVVAVVAGFVAWFDRTKLYLRGFRDARDQALRLKLAPHFLFNTLNALKAQLERDPQGASATLDRLGLLYRQLLERTDRPTVPLREELAFVEAYLGIERARLGDRLRVRIEVPESVEGLHVPTLALQTLIENAIKHGIAPREDGGELLVRAEAKEEKPLVLTLTVENPLPEGPAAATAGTGTGLETLRQRLEGPYWLPSGGLETAVRNGQFQATLRWWATAPEPARPASPDAAADRPAEAT